MGKFNSTAVIFHFSSRDSLVKKGEVRQHKRRFLNVMKYCLRSGLSSIFILRHHSRSYQLNYDVLMEPASSDRCAN